MFDMLPAETPTIVTILPPIEIAADRCDLVDFTNAPVNVVDLD